MGIGISGYLQKTNDGAFIVIKDAPLTDGKECFSLIKNEIVIYSYDNPQEELYRIVAKDLGIPPAIKANNKVGDWIEF